MTADKKHFNVGTKLWHAWDEVNQKYVCKRQPKGATPPPGSGWKEGFAPKEEAERKRLAEEKSRILKGRVMTPAWKENMSKAAKGKPKSEEHKAAMSRAHQARLAKQKPINDAIENNDIEALKVLLLARKDKKST